MAETAIASALTVEQWDDDFYFEYNRDSQFKRYEGMDPNSVFQVKEQLTKEPGDGITVAFVDSLSGDGVSGNTILEGNEEGLTTSGHKISVSPLRHAVLVDEWEAKKTAIDVREAKKMALKFWMSDKKRDSQIRALMSPVTDGKTAYADATENQKDAWLAANADRVLFGAAKSNNSSNDHSDSLANIDNTNDKLDTGMISLARRMAVTASPKIRPIRIAEGEEWFIMFVNSLARRDLMADTAMLQAQREANVRGARNPLFRAGDLMWDGVIIREVEELPVISNGTIDCSVNFLCGAQAVGIGVAQRSQTRDQVTDYGFRTGLAIQEIRGIEKLMRNSTVQNGVVTVYAAGVADS